MARQSSKIMSSADKKVALANIAVAFKEHKVLGRDMTETFNTAAKAFVAAQKTSEAKISAAKKVYDGVIKAASKELAAAQKAHDAAEKKYGKQFDSFNAGTQKLTSKREELESAPTAEVAAKPVRASKKEVPALM